MNTAGFTTLWEFTVPPGRQSEFEAHYGPEGDWVRLFRRATGYLGSELLQDRADPQRYLTVDRWTSPEAWRAFRDAILTAVSTHCSSKKSAAPLPISAPAVRAARRRGIACVCGRCTNTAGGPRRISPR